jgi:polar amino acid transport system substrate-binding protein
MSRKEKKAYNMNKSILKFKIKMRKKMYGKMIILTALLVSLLFPISATSRPLLIIGIPEAPLRFYDGQGLLTGIDIEIVQHIFDKLKINYHVDLISSSSRLKEMWQNKQADMVFTFSYKESRAKYLVFAKESHLHISWNFFILKNNEGTIFYKTFKDLKGLEIGATKGFAYTKEFWDAADSGIFTVETVPINKLNMRKLRERRMDATPMNTLVALYEAKQEGYLDEITYLPKPLKSKPYYNTFVRESDYPGLDKIIKKYDEELKKMKQDGTLKRILTSYGYR